MYIGSKYYMSEQIENEDDQKIKDEQKFLNDKKKIRDTVEQFDESTIEWITPKFEMGEELGLKKKIEQGLPLNILVIGAHPDDCDICCGGTAVLWRQMGYNVKFVSVTNGDCGSHLEGGGMLAKRRRSEAKRVSQFLDIEYQVLNNHDGELLPTINVRNEIIKIIREFKADVVIMPRPNDYHPDHRSTSLVVQDSAYMVMVPNVVSDVPPLYNNPSFFYCEDRFEKPLRFQPDVVVDIESVIEKKIYSLSLHESQFNEWLPWIEKYSSENVYQFIYSFLKKPITPQMLETSKKFNGNKQVRYVECFEMCEYGPKPTEEMLLKIFPSRKFKIQKK